MTDASDIEKIELVLAPDMAAFVREVMAGDTYGSVGELVDDALRLLRRERDADAADCERLREAIREGEESGLAEEFDIEAIKVEARGLTAAAE